ncbi:XRE family transcriptional regulator [Rhizobium deserti]|uniref:XRE family transcriptional regulator n=1 Tax=Rhizobium deserti TaxID=2547961 RepID=A0A4R5UNB3_9HYPH|nr:helix-turn-helix transcriptional regulator [Rhizobium deserti]TDK39258.1 XRE family transcriptional regulator [Rhizobium deserti]
MDSLYRLLRAARDVLDLSQTDVAEAARVSTRTINRIETGAGLVSFSHVGQIRIFLESRGVVFLDPTDEEDWTLMLPQWLAPAPDKNLERGKLYHPLPGPLFRAARVALGFTQRELGLRARLAHTTVRRLEKSDVEASPELAYVLQRHLEKEGVKFFRPVADAGWRMRLTPAG